MSYEKHLVPGEKLGEEYFWARQNEVGKAVWFQVVRSRGQMDLGIEYDFLKTGADADVLAHKRTFRKDD